MKRDVVPPFAICMQVVLEIHKTFGSCTINKMEMENHDVSVLYTVNGTCIKDRQVRVFPAKFAVARDAPFNKASKVAI